MTSITRNLAASSDSTDTKLGDKTHAFVKKAVDIAAQHPDILPASHSVEDVRNSAELFQSMGTIRLALEQLSSQVYDTTLKVGSDAYALARAIYAATKSPIAGPRLSTAADNLGRRYGRKTRAATAAAKSPANGTPAPPETPSTVPAVNGVHLARFYFVAAACLNVAKCSHEAMNIGFRGCHFTLPIEL